MTPWFALDSEREARTLVKGIQEVLWFVNPTESSSSRVLYRGEVDVLHQENMESTHGSVTWGNGLITQWANIKHQHGCKTINKRCCEINPLCFFLLIVSVTKFSIVIGSPRAYLSRNRRAITWVSNYRWPIWTFPNWTPVIGYPRDFHLNYARFNGFLSNVFYNSQNLGKAQRTFFLKRSS